MHVRKSLGSRKRREIVTLEELSGEEAVVGKSRGSDTLSTISVTQAEMPSLLILVVFNTGEDSVPVCMHHAESHYTEAGNSNLYLSQKKARLSNL